VLTLAIPPTPQDEYQIARVGRVRFVINQSVVPVDLELSPEVQSVFPLSAI
jgi:hypothetical protein